MQSAMPAPSQGSSWMSNVGVANPQGQQLALSPVKPRKGKSEIRRRKRSQVTPPDPNYHPMVSGNEVLDDLWKKLLRPLSLLDCLRLEAASKAFAQIIYAGQNRFVWNKKFQDYLFRKGITRTPNDINKFLAVILPKIGAACSQLILKVDIFPANYPDHCPTMKALRSLYLKMEQKTDQGIGFFSGSEAAERLFPGLAQCKDDLELRVVIDEAEDYFDKDRFKKCLTKLAPKLTGIQLWKTETECTEMAAMGGQLKKLRFFLDEDSMVLFKHMAAGKSDVKPKSPSKQSSQSGCKLTELHLEWQLVQAKSDAARDLCESIGCLRQLTVFSIKVDWFAFRDIEPYNLLSSGFRLPPTIRKVSIEVAHTNYRSPALNRDLIAALAGKSHLPMLRIVATNEDSFPLAFNGGLTVDTLEVVFNCTKTYRQVCLTSALTFPFSSCLISCFLSTCDNNLMCLLHFDDIISLTSIPPFLLLTPSVPPRWLPSSRPSRTCPPTPMKADSSSTSVHAALSFAS